MGQSSGGPGNDPHRRACVVSVCMGEGDELQKKLESQRRLITSLEDRIRTDEEWSGMQRVLGLGIGLVIVAMFLPWRHEAERGPNDVTNLFAFGAGAAVVALIVAFGVFISNEPKDTAEMIIVTSLVALALLGAALFVSIGNEDHAPVGPGAILAAVGCATNVFAGTVAWGIDRRPSS